MKDYDMPDFNVRGEDVGCIACEVCAPIYESGAFVCPHGGPFREWDVRPGAVSPITGLRSESM